MSYVSFCRLQHNVSCSVGKQGTIDHAVYNTHNADCADCDWRINKVNAKDWKMGSTRPIYLPREGYPQLVLKDRGYTWNPANLENMTQKPTWETMYNQVLGHIPQVEHTYALVEG